MLAAHALLALVGLLASGCWQAGAYFVPTVPSADLPKEERTHGRSRLQVIIKKTAGRFPSGTDSPKSQVKFIDVVLKAMSPTAPAVEIRPMASTTTAFGKTFSIRNC